MAAAALSSSATCRKARRHIRHQIKGVARDKGEANNAGDGYQLVV